MECPNSPTGKHVPDMNTLSLNRERDDVYVDVNCAHCGKSGCLAHVTNEEVNWE